MVPSVPSSGGVTAFLGAARAFLDASVTDEGYRDEWHLALETAARQVYSAVVVTESALQNDEASIPEALVRRLVEISENGIFVVAVAKSGRLPTGLPSEVRSFGDDGPRLLVARPDEVRELLRGRGIRPARILGICGIDEADELLGLPREPTAPPVFVVAPDSQDNSRFPVFKLGNPQDEGVWLWAPPDEEGTIPALEDTLPILSAEGALSGPGATLYLLDSLILASRVNVAETASSLTSLNPPLLRRFAVVANVARENLDAATQVLQKRWGEQVNCEQLLASFDPRSGGVCFNPEDWREIVEKQNSRGPLRLELARFFNARLPNFWQPDRPCQRRILYTPTKVLLRGEEYYANMRNMSPFDRLDVCWDACDEMQRIWGKIYKCEPVDDHADRKLLIAFFDQLRNIALQTLSYVHAGAPLFHKAGQPSLTLRFQGLFGDENRGVHSFADRVTTAFYSFVLGFDTQAMAAATEAFTGWTALRRDLSNLCSAARKAVEEEPTSVGSLGSLVRRWREADNPLENLLTAILAAEPSRNGEAVPQKVVAAGIGWGGIELPLIFRFLRRNVHNCHDDHYFIARWSHYRKGSPPPEWDAFPGSTTDLSLAMGSVAVLFDDNVLTGVTLERIRDELLLHGATAVKMYVGRYSGERREAQMRMEGHGVVDPYLLGKEIGGFLGETPFARSWSVQHYENPIGVFSLSRRRILECIHNNSTVQLYDREGF